MKKKILIADKLIQPFEKVYKLKFNLDWLWKIRNQSNLLEHEAVIVTGWFKTNKIINQSIINSLSKDAYIINISKGSAINEGALLKALQNNKIKGAALDVFNNEPNINPKFKKLKNVILSPHHASGTKKTRVKWQN